MSGEAPKQAVQRAGGTSAPVAPVAKDGQALSATVAFGPELRLVVRSAHDNTPVPGLTVRAIKVEVTSGPGAGAEWSWDNADGAFQTLARSGKPPAYAEPWSAADDAELAEIEAALGLKRKSGQGPAPSDALTASSAKKNASKLSDEQRKRLGALSTKARAWAAWESYTRALAACFAPRVKGVTQTPAQILAKDKAGKRTLAWADFEADVLAKVYRAMTGEAYANSTQKLHALAGQLLDLFDGKYATDKRGLVAVPLPPLSKGKVTVEFAQVKVLDPADAEKVKTERALTAVFKGQSERGAGYTSDKPWSRSADSNWRLAPGAPERLLRKDYDPETLKKEATLRLRNRVTLAFDAVAREGETHDAILARNTFTTRAMVFCQPTWLEVSDASHLIPMNDAEDIAAGTRSQNRYMAISTSEQPQGNYYGVYGQMSRSTDKSWAWRREVFQLEDTPDPAGAWYWATRNAPQAWTLAFATEAQARAGASKDAVVPGSVDAWIGDAKAPADQREARLIARRLRTLVEEERREHRANLERLRQGIEAGIRREKLAEIEKQEKAKKPGHPKRTQAEIDAEVRAAVDARSAATDKAVAKKLGTSDFRVWKELSPCVVKAISPAEVESKPWLTPSLRAAAKALVDGAKDACDARADELEASAKADDAGASSAESSAKAVRAEAASLEQQAKAKDAEAQSLAAEAKKLASTDAPGAQARTLRSEALLAEARALRSAVNEKQEYAKAKDAEAGRLKDRAKASREEAASLRKSPRVFAVVWPIWAVRMDAGLDATGYNAQARAALARLAEMAGGMKILSRVGDSGDTWEVYQANNPDVQVVPGKDGAPDYKRISLYKQYNGLDAALSAVQLGRTHHGIDQAGAVNDPVFAVCGGAASASGSKVYQANKGSTGGVSVTLSHWNGGATGYTYSGYVHLEEHFLPEAKKPVVRAGDVVGYLGRTGNGNGASPTHLHFNNGRERPPVDGVEVLLPHNGHYKLTPCGADWYAQGSGNDLTALPATRDDTNKCPTQPGHPMELTCWANLSGVCPFGKQPVFVVPTAKGKATGSAGKK